MPKRILFESAVHQLANTGKRKIKGLESLVSKPASLEPQIGELKKFIHSWHFEHLDKGRLKIAWAYPNTGETELDYRSVHFYTRGDSPKAVEEQKQKGLIKEIDIVKLENEKFFDMKFDEIATLAGIKLINC